MTTKPSPGIPAAVALLLAFVGLLVFPGVTHAEPG